MITRKNALKLLGVIATSFLGKSYAQNLSQGNVLYAWSSAPIKIELDLNHFAGFILRNGSEVVEISANEIWESLHT